MLYWKRRHEPNFLCAAAKKMTCMRYVFEMPASQIFYLPPKYFGQKCWIESVIVEEVGVGSDNG